MKKCVYQYGNITIFNSSLPQIGYIARTTTVGKEYDMVEKYLDYLKNKYSKLKNKKVAIFIEPQIDTGYPDIVIVEYYNENNFEWKGIRNSLKGIDLKILFFIQKNGKVNINDISTILGYSLEEIRKTIDKLFLSGLVILYKNKTIIRSYKLKKYFKVNKIIAIEAKIDKWQEAIRQANNNIWFSTESYVLMNKKNCSETIINDCESLGIGIILINGKIETILKSTKRSNPVSYASLQFNEWLMRYLNMFGGISIDESRRVI